MTKRPNKRQNIAGQKPSVTWDRSAAASDASILASLARQGYFGPLGGPSNQLLSRETRVGAQHDCEEQYLNNPTIAGALVKISALTVGVGPSLKILGPRKSYGAPDLPDLKEKCQHLEQEWDDYRRDAKLYQKLQLAIKVLHFHGEVLLRKVPSSTIEEGFTYELIRPERLANPYDFYSDPCVYDGIRFDRPGDGAIPILYYILKEYVNPTIPLTEYEAVPASEIIHVFKPLLEQQRRGMPSFQSSLPRLVQIRELIHATLNTMINYAKLGLIMTTDNEDLIDDFAKQNGGLQGFNPDNPNNVIQIPEGGMFAPPGYEPKSLEPKQPVATFGETKTKMTGDVGATLGLGSGKINNDHSAYNFSSAKMDEQHDTAVTEQDQFLLGEELLDAILDDWFDAKADLDPVADEILVAAGSPDRIRRKWLFPEPRPIDELKAAQADEINLNLGATTLQEIYARKRLDADDILGRWLSERQQVAQGLQAAGAGLSTTGKLMTQPEGDQNGEIEGGVSSDDRDDGSADDPRKLERTA